MTPVPGSAEESVIHSNTIPENVSFHPARGIIESIKSQPPTTNTVALIPLILEFQNRNPKAWDFETLKQWAWLPARRNRDRWFRPNELYSDEEGHLFESQVEFLEVPATTRDAVENVLTSLGVNYRPTERLVVRHLLFCAKQKKRVNSKVYDWLNDRTSSPELDQLWGQPCILLPDGTYVRPNHVFWKSSSFGRFRPQLPAEWRKRDPLYRRLSVRDEPVASDAILLLCEIAGELGPAQQKIDEETRLVNLACWKMLEAALASGQITPVDLSRYGKIKSVCTSDGMLQSPEQVFFNDRTGLAEKFVDFPRKNFIVPPPGAWRAMEAAGVRRLSRMVEPHLVEAVGPIPNERMRRHIGNLKHPLARVLDVRKSDSADTSELKQKLDSLDGFNYVVVQRLVIKYTFDFFSRPLESNCEIAEAQFIAKENTLYFALSPRNQKPRWTAIARELAAVLVPDNEPGLLSGAINTVLDADSVEDANAKLNELGIPDLEFREHDAPVVTSTVIKGLGGETLPPGEESAVTAPAAPVGERVAQTVETSKTSPMGNETPASHQASSATPPTPRDTSERSQAKSPPTQKSTPSKTPPGSLTANRPDAEPRDADDDEFHDDDRDVNHWTARHRDANDKDDGNNVDYGSDDDADDFSGRPSSGRPRQERRRDGVRRGYSNLKSFVMPDRLEEDVIIDSEGHAHRSAVGQAGVARVMEYERTQGRIPQEMPTNHPGYDVKSFNATGQIQRYIEVKSFPGDWHGTAAGLTRKQFDRAIGLKDQYWLYVVERAQSADFRIHRIQNPAGKTDRFMFDDGWKQVAK